jgi:hypothetical protein
MNEPPTLSVGLLLGFSPRPGIAWFFAAVGCGMNKPPTLSVGLLLGFFRL